VAKAIPQVDSNIRTQIQVLWGPPALLSTRCLLFSQHLGPSKSSTSLYCSVCNSYQSEVKSIKAAEETIQVNWKCTLDIGVKNKIWFNDDFDSSDIVLSHPVSVNSQKDLWGLPFCLFVFCYSFVWDWMDSVVC